jgi:hypothetical protein
MAPERRQQILLGVLAAVLVLVGYRTWTGTSSPAAPASNRAGAAPGPARPGTAPAAPDVHLQALGDEKPKPGAGDRNLFRFQPVAPPPPPPRITKPEPVVPPVPTGPPPPPPLPPIQLKFIGIVVRGGGDSGTPAVKVAVLSDPAGHVMYGVEGGTIDGRFRIARIGEQSIELSYLDGRGRQTIRLSGS